MAYDELDFLNNTAQTNLPEDDDLKKSSLYQSSQRLRIENISSQSDVHGGGSNILIKEEHRTVESTVAQLPESAIIKSEALTEQNAVPLSNPTLPDPIRENLQPLIERGTSQAPDTHIPGKTTRGADEKLSEIVVHQNQFQQKAPHISPPPPLKEQSSAQIKEIPVDIYESPKINIFGDSAILTQEDTSFGLSLSYTYSSKVPVDNIEVVLRGIPSDFVVTSDASGLVIQLTAQTDGSYTFDIGDLSSISINPPDNYSGNTTFQAYITGTTQDGINLVSPSLAITASVQAIADQPTETVTDITGIEDSTAGLNNLFSATSPDAIGIGLYGSEVITTTLEGIPSNIKLYYEGAPGTYLSQDSHGDWIVDPAKLSLVRFETPANYKGEFTVTMVATATEPSNGDSKSVYQDFDVTINAVADGFNGYINQSLSGNEDTIISTSSSSYAAEIVLSDPTETIHVTMSNLPSGASVQLYDGSVYNSTSSTGTVDITSWGRIITESGVTKWVLDQLLVTPKAYSDTDFNLNFSAYTIDSGPNATVTSVTTNFDIPITVLAVAQPAQVSALSNITTNTDGSWVIHMTEDSSSGTFYTFSSNLTDTDGSEVLSNVITGIPVGATVEEYNSSGQLIATNNGVQAELTLVNTSNGTIYLKIIPPTNSSDNFSLNLTAQTEETNPDDSQVTTRYNTATIPIEVIIDAKADPADIHIDVNNNDYSSNFTTSINEHIPSETYTPVTFSFTTNSTDLIDSTGPETITAITLTGLPSGTIITSSYITGGSYTTTTAGDIITFNILSEQTSITGDYSIVPPTNYEATINAVLSVTTTEPTTGNSLITIVNQTINIDPVASTPTISAQATYQINEDPAANSPYQTLTFNTNDATTDDLHVTLSGLQPGSTITSVSNPSIHLTVNADGTVTMTDQNWPDLYSGTPGNLIDSGTIEFRIIPPLNYSSTASETITVTATAIDGTSTAISTSSFDLIVNPVADPLNHPGYTATDITEPAPYTPDLFSTVTLTLPLSDTDSSESITSVILQNIPDGFSIKVQDIHGVWTTASLISDGHGYNTASLLDYGVMNGNQLSIHVYPSDTAYNDVNLTAIVTNTDTGVATDTHTTTIPITFSIEQILNDATVTPTSVSGNEDAYILLDLGVTLADPSEYFSHLDISGVLTGGGIYIDNGSGKVLVTGGDLLSAGWTANSSVYYLPPPNNNTDITLHVDYQVTEPYGPTGPIVSNLEHTTIGVTVLGQTDIPTITSNGFFYTQNTPTSIGLNLTTLDTDGSETYHITLGVASVNGYNDWSILNGTTSTSIIPSTINTMNGSQTYEFDGTYTQISDTINHLRFDSNNSDGTFEFSLSGTVIENDYNTTTNPGGQIIFSNSFTGEEASALPAFSTFSLQSTSSSENVILDINDNVTSITDTDFITISGFSSNTDFYSVDSNGNQSLIGQTDTNGTIILTGNQVNGLDGHELYYDNMNGYNTFDMILHVGDGTTQSQYEYYVDQHTGQMTAAIFNDMTYTDPPTLIDQTTTSMDQQHQY